METTNDAQQAIAQLTNMSWGVLHAAAGGIKVTRAPLYSWRSSTRREAGDLEAARVLSDTIAKLLAITKSGNGATVIDLERERERRGGK